MDLIFCLSNLFVPHTLTLIKGGKEKVMIYTDQEGMNDFFNELNLPNVEVFYRKDLLIGRDITSAKRIITKRNEVLRFLLEKKPQRVYFFHNTFGHIENWIIKRLSAKSEAFHIPVFNDFPFFEKKYNLKSLIGILKSYYIHNIVTVPLWAGDRFIYKVPENFFLKYNIKKLEPEIDENYVNSIMSKKMRFVNKKIVLLTGSVVETGQVEESEYIKKIDNLINTIGKEKIIAKPHPRFPNRYGLEKELDTIPHYIPANVLFTTFDVFIGYYSSVISEAANKGLSALSTLDYFDSKNEEKAKIHKEYLNVNKKSGEIHFFTDLSSLSILK